MGSRQKETKGKSYVPPSVCPPKKDTPTYECIQASLSSGDEEYTQIPPMRCREEGNFTLSSVSCALCSSVLCTYVVSLESGRFAATAKILDIAVYECDAVC